MRVSLVIEADKPGSLLAEHRFPEIQKVLHLAILILGSELIGFSRTENQPMIACSYFLVLVSSNKLDARIFPRNLAILAQNADHPIGRLLASSRSKFQVLSTNIILVSPCSPSISQIFRRDIFYIFRPIEQGFCVFRRKCFLGLPLPTD
jgi:hypothetical protein